MDTQTTDQTTDQTTTQATDQTTTQTTTQTTDQTTDQAATQPPAATLEGLTLSEGFEVSQEDFTALGGIFKEAGVEFTQDLAQKLVEFEENRQGAFLDSQGKAHEARVAQWGEDVKKDPEIGGDKFDENIVAAQEAVKALATPELTSLLEQTGLGNHPEMVRLFLKLAPLVREDRPGLPGGRGGNTEKSVVETLYGSN